MISFTIPGTPVPQGRPRVTSAGHAYYDKRTQDYRELVKQCAIVAQAGRETLTGALAVMCEFVFEPPKSWPKHRIMAALHGGWHISSKDLDNCVKAVLDSAMGVCYEDDKQIALLLASKSYGEKPMAKISILELNEVKNPRWLIASVKREIEKGCSKW
jgi:Holliday junction resolvase RusA-like endonuclease